MRQKPVGLFKFLQEYCITELNKASSIVSDEFKEITSELEDSTARRVKHELRRRLKVKKNRIVVIEQTI
jgi:hypothetical protein